MFLAAAVARQQLVRGIEGCFGLPGLAALDLAAPLDQQDLEQVVAGKRVVRCDLDRLAIAAHRDTGMPAHGRDDAEAV